MWARAFTVCGAFAAAATVAGHAVAATPSPARALNGGGVQANPGGIVKDETGGYYDAARSTYVAASAATAVGGGVQAKPGGIVKDKTGGYYDPARSTYIPASASAATTVGGGVQAKPGGIVKDKTGGYYDPARSTYITAKGNAAPPLPSPISARGFSWTDATVGAGVATGTILILLGATLLTLRRRILAA
jgi:hypothetical protein